MTTSTGDYLVSVVIPTKNAGHKLRHVLDIVLNQEVNWPYEVLVIDSGSTDETINIAKLYSSVRLITIAPRDFGHGKTRNFAIANTSGQYIAMLTQDAIPANTLWLAELVNAIDMDPRIAGVFGRHIAYTDASPFTRHELEQHFLGFSFHPVVELDNHRRYKEEEGYRQFLYFFSDNNALLRRTIWQKIPYPDIDFAEDQAWARLIIEAGYRKAYAHNAVVYHSHNFGFIERLQRSFDESFAFRRLFNYQYGQGVYHAVLSLLAMTIRDFRFAFQAGLFKTDILQVFSMPLDNLMRAAGHYLGSNGSKIPECIRMCLSRDRQLMMASQGDTN